MTLLQSHANSQISPPISHIDFDIIIDLSMIILQLLTYSVNRFFFGSPYWYRLIVDDRSMIIP